MKKILLILSVFTTVLFCNSCSKEFKEAWHLTVNNPFDFDIVLQGDGFVNCEQWDCRVRGEFYKQYPIWSKEVSIVAKDVDGNKVGEVTFSKPKPDKEYTWTAGFGNEVKETDYGSGSSGGSGSGGSGGTGGTGGSGNTDGSVVFYGKPDMSCGQITVTVNGSGSKKISNFYGALVEIECGMEGCANYTLTPGTYTYTAKCDGRSWGPASFTVTASGCKKIKLQ